MVYIQLIVVKGIINNEEPSCATGDDQLLFARTLCRHGDRNAYIFYPNDPWKAESNWPGGYGVLTNMGKLQQFELGQYFRKRYASLIGNGYSVDKVYIQSTDLDRTLTSAEANVAGLFPPNPDQIWNSKLYWQPIAVHTQPRSDDYLLAGDKRCDHFDYVMLQYLNGSEYKYYFTESAALINHLEHFSGQSLKTITDINSMYDVLFVERLQHKRLPDWARRVMIKGGDFERLNNYWFELFTKTPEMKKLRSGYLLKDIFDRFVNKTRSSLVPDRSMWMYFAHDITLSNMLNSLGVFNGVQPPYSSCILFELYQAQTGPYVQFYFRNSTETYVPPLYIPNCGTKCPLYKLYEIYQAILPTQSFDEECVLQNGEQLPPGGNPENNAL